MPPKFHPRILYIAAVYIQNTNNTGVCGLFLTCIDEVHLMLATLPLVIIASYANTGLTSLVTDDVA